MGVAFTPVISCAADDSAVRGNSVGERSLEIVPDADLKKAQAVMDDFLQTQSNGALRELLKQRRSGSKAVDVVLPQFAGLILAQSDESVVCDVFDMFLSLDSLPVSIQEAVTERFARSDADEPFAKAKAAAILLRCRSDNGAKAWLRQRLIHKKPYARLTAAAALGEAGESAQDSLPALHRLLKDQSAAVRVAAAGAIWNISQDADTVVPVLLQSLSDRGEAFVLKPVGVSDTGLTHRHMAVLNLSVTKTHTMEVVRTLLTLLQEDDDTLKLIVLRFLAKVGNQSSQVIQAVRCVASTASNGSVKAEAAITLGELTKDSRLDTE